jgi:riboflavin synthase
MFTGIIETIGLIKNIIHDQTNIHYEIQTDLTHELKIDQSVAHDGVCLTVVQLTDTTHTVTAIQETLQVTSLRNWQIGKKLNIERCMSANGRFDGHIVQGHVDKTANCIDIKDESGSWLLTFQFEDEKSQKYIVKKGSICVNGTSLTVVDCDSMTFSVALIPYTFEHTSFHDLKKGDVVNIEFDVIGKYVEKMLQSRTL